MHPSQDPVVRATGVGGSEVGCLFGVDPYKTPFTLWLLKRGLLESGPGSTDFAWWGHDLEPRIIRRYAMIEGVFVVANNAHGNPALFTPRGAIASLRSSPLAKWEEALLTLRYPGQDHRMCHLDGVVFERLGGDPVRLLEVKNRSAYVRSQWGDPRTPDVPPRVSYQVQHNSMIGSEVLFGGELLDVDVAVLFGGNTFEVYEVEGSERTQAKGAAKVDEFWGFVEAGDPPPPSWNEIDHKALGRLWEPQPKAKVLRPGDPLQAIGRARSLAAKQETFHGNLKKQAEAKLKAAMKECEALQGWGWRFTWKKSSPKPVTDWEAVHHETMNHLALHGSLSKADRDAIVERNTTTPEGSRRGRFVDETK